MSSNVYWLNLWTTSLKSVLANRNRVKTFKHQWVGDSLYSGRNGKLSLTVESAHWHFKCLEVKLTGSVGRVPMCPSQCPRPWDFTENIALLIPLILLRNYHCPPLIDSLNPLFPSVAWCRKLMNSPTKISLPGTSFSVNTNSYREQYKKIPASLEERTRRVPRTKGSCPREGPFEVFLESF